MVDSTLAELSNGRLVPTAAQADGSPIGDVTEWMWPTYRRQTVADGGDDSASFTIYSSDKFMEEWLENYLGAHFEETYRGEAAFMGRVHTMRLSYQRVILTTSLDWIFNRIACYYTSVLSGSTFLGSFYDDTASQTKWGIRTLLLRPSDEIGLSEADDLSQQLLAQTAVPRISRGRVNLERGRQQRGSLKVDIRGYAHSLDAQLHNEVNPGQDDASVEVANALAGASYVTVGTITENTKQVTITADQRPKLQRIKWIAEQRDALGRRYNYGCFGSQAFDYFPADTDAIRYNVQVKPAVPLHFNAREEYVPAPLVQPGGISFITDIMPGRQPAQPILDDPRAQFDRSVVYSINGADLRGDLFDQKEAAQAIQMSIMARR